MKARPLFALFIVLAAATLGRAAERVESFSWDVGDAPILKLETERGGIIVEHGEANRVTLLLQASTASATSDRWLESLAVAARPFGAGLSIQVKNASAGVEFGVGPELKRDVRLVLRVPSTCNLDLSTTLGSVEVANDFTGAVRVRSRDGNVFVGRIEGSVTVDTLRGNITVARATGDLKARTGIGDVTVGTILGRAELQAKNGSIAVMSAQGDLAAEAVRGDVAASFGRQLPENVSLKASAGNVNVAIDPQAALRVDAKAVWGKVQSQLPFQTAQQGKRRLEGSINGGGPLLALRADGGDITINAVPTYDDFGF